MKEFRATEAPRHFCEACSAPFALLSELRTHRARACPCTDAFWEAELPPLPEEEAPETAAEREARELAEKLKNSIWKGAAGEPVLYFGDIGKPTHTEWRF